MKHDFLPRHKSLNESGLKLLDDYIMAYSHFDGFTARLLGIDLLIDKNFKLTVFHHSFMLGSQHRKSEDDFYFIKKVEPIPDVLFSFLERIIENDVSQLNKQYDFEGISMDDNPSQLYLFNTDSGTKSVHINGLLPLTEEIFRTKIERDFLKLHLFIKEWTGQMYEDYVANY